jgi:hypothetical protein
MTVIFERGFYGVGMAATEAGFTLQNVDKTSLLLAGQSSHLLVNKGVTSRGQKFWRFIKKGLAKYWRCGTIYTEL